MAAFVWVCSKGGMGDATCVGNRFGYFQKATSGRNDGERTMRKLLILMLFGVLFVPTVGSAQADEVLYCKSDLATGLYPDNGTWSGKGFKEKRFTVKVVGDFEKITGVLKNLMFECSVPFAHNSHQIVCQSKYGMTFLYDKISKKFLYTLVNTSTYLDIDTPIIYAGTCQKF